MKKCNYIIISLTNGLTYNPCIVKDGKLYRSLSDPATVFDDYKTAYKFVRKYTLKMKREDNIFCYYVIIPIEAKK